MPSNSDELNSRSVLIGLLSALAGCAVYSTHDALVKYLTDYSVFQIIFFAMLFGYVPFSVARIFDNTPKSLRPNNPLLVCVRALLIVASLTFAFLGFSMLPLVEVYVLLFCAPFIITLLAIRFLGEKIQLFRWIAIAMGLLGILIVLRPSIERIELGHIFALAAAFCGSCSAIIARKIGNQENTATMILFPLIANIAVSGVALYFVYLPMSLLDLSLMFSIGVLGLVGQYLVLQGYRLAPAAYVAPMQYSQIIWAILFGYVFFNESVDHWVIIGASITIFSGLMIIWREAKISSVQANIKTRNLRFVSAASLDPQEQMHKDEWEWL